MAKKPKLWNVDAFPGHMRGDAERRNDNIMKGFKLCARCEGTGNQMYSMYQKCEACNGKGHKKGNS